MRRFLFAISAVLLFASIGSPARATTVFTFEGEPVLGEAGEEHPSLAPEGTGTFEIDGDMLTLTIVYTGVRDLDTNELVTVPGLNMALSGAVFDIDSSWTGSLDPVSALLVGAIVGNTDDVALWNALAANPLDFSGHVVYADDAVDGTRHAVAHAGSVFGDGEFSKEIFDPSKTVAAFEPVPGGGSFTIVPDLYDSGLNAFKKQGPQGQDTIVYKWIIDDEGGIALDESLFAEFTPIFGTEGEPTGPAVPEPAAGVLFPLGALLVSGSLRRRR
jgi:hypothetical protein